MIDIKATINDDNQITIGFENGDFTHEDGFDTAILIALLTDARAPEDRVSVPQYRRGWMANLHSPVEGRELGGLLWTTEQSRLTPKELNESISFAKLALDHFVEDGLAKSVIVGGSIVPKLGIQLDITITSVSGEVSTHYVKLWELTGYAA